MVAPTGFMIGDTEVTSEFEFLLDERTMPGGIVGALAILDEDDPDQNSYTYTLVDEDGEPATDSVYQIVRDPATGLSSIVVKADVTLDFETSGHLSRNLWVKASDGTDSVILKVTMNVSNVNEAPTDVSLSGTSVPERATTDTEIGALSALDPDLGDTFTFTLTDDADGRFKLDETGTKLLVADGSKLSFATAGSHQVKVLVEDAGGLTFEKTLTVTVTDVVDTVTGTSRNDRMIGTIGADVLRGGSGSDKIYGLAGDDTISGGAGKDVLIGGLGKDTFVFDATVKRGHFDHVYDFKSVDDTLQFNLSALKSFKVMATKKDVYGALKAGKSDHKKSAFSLDKVFKKGQKLEKKFFKIGKEAGDGNDFITYDKKSGKVYLDVDGSGKAKGIEILKVKPGTALTADDFLFI